MEFVNPFKRHEKKDFLPQSIMPASKLTRTSMQIGRVVPVYTIEVMKNNDWRAKISNVSRFMTMHKPVMNDFEVSFGAFYVPYVALDDVTGSPIAARASSVLANYIAHSGLHAREFFNPSTDNNDRVPIVKNVNLAYYGPINLIGSLWDHLQYPIYDDVDIFNLSALGVEDVTLTSHVKLFNRLNYDEDSGITAPFSRITSFDGFFVIDNSNPVAFGIAAGVITQNYAGVGSLDDNADNIVRLYCPFDLWACLNPAFNGGFLASCGSINPFTQFEELVNPNNYLEGVIVEDGSIFDYLDAVLTTGFNRDGYERAFVSFLTAWNNPYNDPSAWSNYFGTYTREQVMDMYIQYLINCAIITSNVGTADAQKMSQAAFLTYLRIYGDYFLNPLITDKEKLFGYLTAVYQHHNVALPGSISDAIDFAVSELGSNDNIEFFLDYLRKGECLPVLWEKDFFTAALIKEQIGDDVVIEDGDSIMQMFYKRMYFKFKNLIARFGSDYRTNSDALYGGKIPDNTLERSQVISFRRFKVNVASIAQTSPTSENGALADFGGFAYAADSDNDEMSWTAQENGLIMVLCWVRPLYTAIKTAIPKLHLKSDYLDYLLPQWSGVGYQDIPFGLLRPSDGAHFNTKFAIQERYFEYMTMINESSGAFRNVARHYAVDREVTEVVQLGENLSPAFLYITEADDINRIFTDRTSDPILASIYIEATVTRQIPSEIRTDF